MVHRCVESSVLHSHIPSRSSQRWEFAPNHTDSHVLSLTAYRQGMAERKAFNYVVLFSLMNEDANRERNHQCVRSGPCSTTKLKMGHEGISADCFEGSIS